MAADQAATPANRITVLNEHDVLLGRGSGFSDYRGNQAFRDLIDDYKVEYNSSSRFDPKKKIAAEIVDIVQSRGGRFLRLVNTEQDMESIVEEGIWEEAPEKAAQEKVKQGLREKRKKEQAAVTDRPASECFDESVEMPFQPGSRGADAVSVPRVQQSVPCFPSTMYLERGIPPTVDPRLALYHQNAAFLPFQPNAIMPSMVWAAQQQQVADVYNAYMVANSLYAQQSGDCPPPRLPVPPLANGRPLYITTTKDVLSSKQDSSYVENEKEDAAFLALSALSVADRPKFSKEAEVREQASLTSEERAAILADTFGKYCTVTPRQNKKARKDLDRGSIEFLIKFMKEEIELTPDEKKEALLEAQKKCQEDEFSDERLERFLRCEGMNAKLAAQRFINYWESRREVFGPEKYLMRMTLSEALSDDLAAIEAGVYVQLPHLDSSGRQLILMEPHRNSREGYSSESGVSFTV